MRLLLDRVVAALARFGTPKARRAVVDHAFRKKPELGNAMERLSELAGQDLSGDSELVERLLAAFKSNSPHKLLGIVLHPNDQALKYIIDALSTTPAPAVRRALEGLIKKFPALEISKAAAKALASLEGKQQIPEAPYDTRSGELDLFGLPALVQGLAEASVSGSLLLRDATGQPFATLRFQEGRLKDCETGGLRGEDAFYQLLERPRAANFHFTRQSEQGSETPGGPAPMEVLPLCLEGMRRYDEFQRTAALVPDHAVLKPGTARATPHPDELDGMFVNELWQKAGAGTTPTGCEAEIAADCFRIRRQLAHWVESGALTNA